MEVVRHGVGVQLRVVAVLRPDGRCEVAEVVGRQRDVFVEGFPNGFAVLPRFGHRQQLDVGVDDVGNTVEHGSAFCGRGFAPGRERFVGGIERDLDVFCGSAGNLGESFPVHGRGVFEVLTLDGFDPLPANPVLVAGFEGHK